MRYARPKRRSVHNDAGYTGSTRRPRVEQIAALTERNGLDLYDTATAGAKRPTTQPITKQQKADRYALMAQAEARKTYREFRRRQVAFKSGQQAKAAA
jgi:hypothetical protein